MVMKRRNTYIALASVLALTMAVGCQKRKIDPDPGPGPVPVPDPQQTEVVLSGNVDARESKGGTKRVTGQNFGVGDSIGVYMYRSGQSLGRGADARSNVPYLQGTFQVLNVAANAQGGAILYPAEAGTQVNFVGYYPYKQGVTDRVQLNLADQQDAAEEFDLLYSDNAKNIATPAPNGGNADEVEMEFRHVLAKINVKVVFDGSFTSPVYLSDIQGPVTFTATGLRTLLAMNMANGAVQVDMATGGEIKMQLPLVDGGVTATANVAPGVALTGLRFTIPLLGYTAHPYTYIAAPSNITYQAGYEYTYTVTLGQGGDAIIGEAVIVPWEDGDAQVIEGETN